MHITVHRCLEDHHHDVNQPQSPYDQILTYSHSSHLVPNSHHLVQTIQTLLTLKYHSTNIQTVTMRVTIRLMSAFEISGTRCQSMPCVVSAVRRYTLPSSLAAPHVAISSTRSVSNQHDHPQMSYLQSQITYQPSVQLVRM
eukprot:sb/3474215/